MDRKYLGTWYVKIMKRIDGAVEYGMVLGGITDHTHSNILYNQMDGEHKCHKNIKPFYEK